MFRDSDYVERRQKGPGLQNPLPLMQQQAQAHQFSAKSVTGTTQKDVLGRQVPEKVPVTRDVYYDPSHPMADWGGYVSKKHPQKIHHSNHRSQQIGIECTENGIISRNERQEFPNRRRADESQVQTTKQTYKMAGIAQPGFDRWQTNYKSFEQGEHTARDQLTFVKRMGTKRVVKDPAQQLSLEYFDPASSSTYHLPSNHPEGGINNGLGGPSINSNLTKNSATSTAGGRNASLISSLGEKIVSRIEGDMPKAMVANEMDSRSLLYQNYKPLPGYTGKKIY